MQTSPTRSSSAAPRLGRVGAFPDALAVAADGVERGPTGAATRNPCRLLTVSQIESVLEQSTAGYAGPLDPGLEVVPLPADRRAGEARWRRPHVADDDRR